MNVIIEIEITYNLKIGLTLSLQMVTSTIFEFIASKQLEKQNTFLVTFFRGKITKFLKFSLRNQFLKVICYFIITIILYFEVNIICKLK